MASDTIVIRGFRDAIKGFADVDKRTRLAARKVLRTTGDAVKTDAAARFARYDARTAAGYRTVVRQRGISVEQSLRKTTGLHPEFGALQMTRALLPAGAAKAPETERAMEHALDVVAALFNQGGPV